METKLILQIAFLIPSTLAIFYSIHYYLTKQHLTTSKTRTKTRTTTTRHHLNQSTRLLSRAKSTTDKSKSQTLSKQALTEAQTALSLDLRDPNAYIIKARVLEFMGHESSALKLLDSALRLPRVKLLEGRERGDVLIKRAELKLSVNKKRRVDSAVEDLREAVRVSGGEFEFKVFRLLSECYEFKGGVREEAMRKGIEEEESLRVEQPRSIVGSLGGE